MMKKPEGLEPGDRVILYPYWMDCTIHDDDDNRNQFLGQTVTVRCAESRFFTIDENIPSSSHAPGEWYTFHYDQIREIIKKDVFEREVGDIRIGDRVLYMNRIFSYLDGVVYHMDGARICIQHDDGRQTGPYPARSFFREGERAETKLVFDEREVEDLFL